MRLISQKYTAFIISGGYLPVIGQFELGMCFLNSVKSTFYDTWTFSFGGKVSFLNFTLFTDTRDSFDILKQKNYQERQADHCLMSYSEALIRYPFEKVVPWVSTRVRRKMWLIVINWEKSD